PNGYVTSPHASTLKRLGSTLFPCTDCQSLHSAIWTETSSPAGISASDSSPARATRRNLSDSRIARGSAPKYAGGWVSTMSPVLPLVSFTISTTVALKGPAKLLLSDEESRKWS